MSEIFEVIMVICFGISWPISIVKSYKSRTAKGKSVIFIIFIIIGYFSGITSKIVGNKINYVLIFYCINLIAVTVDLLLYLRNRRLDAMRSEKPLPWY